MRKRARIIYNPTSGKELFKRVLPDVLIKLEKLAMKQVRLLLRKLATQQ